MAAPPSPGCAKNAALGCARRLFFRLRPALASLCAYPPRFFLSRFACSRRPASLRLGLVSGPLARPFARPRFGPSGLLATAQRFFLSRFACSRRPASLRLGLVSGPLARPFARPRFGPSGLLATAQRFFLSRFACSRRPASLRLGLVSGPLARPFARPRFGPSGLLATAQRFLFASVSPPCVGPLLFVMRQVSSRFHPPHGQRRSGQGHSTAAEKKTRHETGNFLLSPQSGAHSMWR